MFFYSAVVAAFLVWLWRKDDAIEHADYSLILNAAAIIFLACVISATPNMINTSKVISTEFRTIEVVDKHIETYWQSWENEKYHFQLGEEDELIHSGGFSVSKKYYDSVQIGDEIPVCVYTGILGKQFYSFFEDPKKDYYDYNQWTCEEYQKYLSEQ